MNYICLQGNGQPEHAGRAGKSGEGTDLVLHQGLQIYRDEHYAGENQQKHDDFLKLFFLNVIAAGDSAQKTGQHEGHQPEGGQEKRQGEDAGKGIEKDSKRIFNDEDGAKITPEGPGILCISADVCAEQGANPVQAAEDTGKKTKENHSEGRICPGLTGLVPREHFKTEENHNKAEEEANETPVQILKQKDAGQIPGQNHRRQGDDNGGIQVFPFPDGEDDIGRITQYQIHRGNLNVLDRKAENGIENQCVGKSTDSFDKKSQKRGKDPPESHLVILPDNWICFLPAAGKTCCSSLLQLPDQLTQTCRKNILMIQSQPG